MYDSRETDQVALTSLTIKLTNYTRKATENKKAKLRAEPGRAEIDSRETWSRRLDRTALIRLMAGELCLLGKLFFCLCRQNTAECQGFAGGVHLDGAFVNHIALDQGFGKFVLDIFLQRAA